eukprot:CAMPEP_0194298656 /NCGR_PEP_ID=MMETSP0169-20130528/60286_1 /TAXON_ID=218684 /ORGANISM="Corethron pennatum, Strain L29A3" /LENGTH=681 /DNA_ID=CAMNT_0039048665 /DNA_START=31 /DNA_END=2073 /DNA_ORIENTATION=-
MNILLFSFYLLSHLNGVWTLRANSWQKRLDRAFLDVDVKKPEARIRSIQRALQDPNLPKDISKGISAIREKGFGKGHPELIEALWPEGTIARSDLEGIQALTKSLPERREEQTSVGSLVQTLSKSLTVPNPSTVVSGIVSQILSDPSRAVKLAKNVFRETPAGIETLDYSVIRTISTKKDDVTLEVREYPGYEAVSAPLQSEDFTLTNMGAGLTELSSYLLFGNNAGEEIMTMTVPFVIQSSTMWVPLSREYAQSPPETVDQLALRSVPSQTLATLAFRGICTNAEIERQTQTLMDAIDAEPTLSCGLGHSVQVFQYNAPGILPWRRRNEIALVVEVAPVEIGSGGDIGREENGAGKAAGAIPEAAEATITEDDGSGVVAPGDEAADGGTASEEQLKGSSLFPNIRSLIPNDERVAASTEEMNPKDQTESELQFLEDTAATMVDYYRQSIEIGGKPVVISNTPESLRTVFDDAGVSMEFEHNEPSWEPQQLRDAVDTVLQTSVRSSSPLFLNQLYAGVDPIALGGEWLSATLNSNVHTFEVAPSLTEIEKSCLAKISRCWLKTESNMDTPDHDGLFVPGGSISILYSQLLARDRFDNNIRKSGLSANSNLVAFCSENSHYSYKKSAIVTGLGEDNLISVKCLLNGSMDPKELKIELEKAVANGKTPFYIGTTAGTTVLGAF